MIKNVSKTIQYCSVINQYYAHTLQKNRVAGTYNTSSLEGRRVRQCQMQMPLDSDDRVGRASVEARQSESPL